MYMCPCIKFLRLDYLYLYQYKTLSMRLPNTRFGGLSQTSLPDFRQAAKNGTYNCAINYLTGRGCSQDVKKAEELLQLAEDRGSSEAAALLGDLAISNNLGEAAVRKHLEKAVSLGNTNAFYFMALCYQSGWWSYPHDSQNAFSYFKKAADNGHIEACKRVAELYRTGNGCQMDLKRAKEYENKAKEQH